MLRFDHVIMAVPDLESAAVRFQEEHGLGWVEGGRHNGHGTANRLVPLGPDYLELVAVVDRSEAARSPFGRWVGEHAGPGARAGLCLRTLDISGLGKSLGIVPIAMSRTRPDGVVLSWRLLGLETALSRGLPFFIEWDGPAANHPGRAEATHRVSPRGIAWVELGGEPATVDDWLGSHALDLRLIDGDPGVHRVGVATADGELVL
jgi:hypothetical protein